MSSIQHDMDTFRAQLQSSSIQKAYRALIAFMMSLRTHFVARYGESAVSALYQGYLDMSYFALFPPSLKLHGLKVAIVFNFTSFRFEAWLSARNRTIERQFWEIFKDSRLTEYRIAAPGTGVDSILEVDLATDFNLDAPEALTAQIDDGVTDFIQAVEGFLSAHKPASV